MRNFVLILIVSAAAMAVPALYRQHPQAFEALLKAAAGTDAPQTASTASVHVAAGVETERDAVPRSGRKVRIEAGNAGHFVADFRLNGRRVEAMVDTGASTVAINETTARRIGIALSPADFKYTVNTANGATKAAAARIDSLEIGRIRVEDVDAAVLRDEALGKVLIGMSFLKRLDRYAVEDGTLLLEQ